VENGARHSHIHLLNIKTSSVVMEITESVFFMGRKPRIEYEGAVCHVIQMGKIEE
jgi:hypothetical protein